MHDHRSEWPYHQFEWPRFPRRRKTRHAEVMGALHYIERRLNQLEHRIMATLKDLIDQVEASTTVEASAAAMIKGLVDKLETAHAEGDPKAIQSVISKLKSSADQLVTALVAGTVAEDEGSSDPSTGGSSGGSSGGSTGETTEGSTEGSPRGPDVPVS